MFESIARDLVLGTVAQDVQSITHLDEAICRRAVVEVCEASPLPLSEATDALLAGLREQDTRNRIVVAFWDAAERLSHEQGEPTQPLGDTK